LERIYESTDDAVENIEKLNPKNASNNPQQFANDASKTATKVKQVAAYLREKAKDADSPLRKQELTDMANDLDKTSNQIIDETNALLQDIDNPQKQEKLKHTLDDAKSKLEKSTTIFER